MDTKAFIWIGMAVGSTAGSFLPSVWGSSLFSVWSIILSGVGGIAGIWLGYKISKM